MFLVMDAYIIPKKNKKNKNIIPGMHIPGIRHIMRAYNSCVHELPLLPRYSVALVVSPRFCTHYHTGAIAYCDDNIWTTSPLGGGCVVAAATVCT